MKKIFMCSFIHNGIIGGGLYIDHDSIIYKTNKLTVDKKYRNLILPLNEIKEITWKGVIATIQMNNNEEYKIMIFNKNSFIKCYQEI